ncbi:PAS-domain containing protein [Cognatishimia sp. SS12]|uniref:hybrid sensor histidine kinase/response regulator n=1 Tax=Cognatishimia sp. SS12 TaxID=2979465 RepID=UPI00232B61A2|nr:PAS-domain containing protein [Cognatishimia sp. SS12]MDC0738021.1 PAS-domain containing protein [Cognatishimia sp. SS12]
MAPRSDSQQAMMMAGLNLIQQALSIYDDQLRLVVANARFRDMFDLPEHLMTPGASFEDTIRVIASRGEYGDSEDVEALVQERVERAKDFEPHYMERQRHDGRWISVEGTPLPGGGWVAVYTDITRTKRQEALLRGRSEELSDQLLRYAEELSSANRELESTIVALEEAKRQVTISERRMRLTAEMMPAHIAHVGPDRRYTYSNRRLTAIMPGRPSNIIGHGIAHTLGQATYDKIEPYLNAAFEGAPGVFEFNDPMSSRRIRLALTPDSEKGDERGVYILSMDVTAETQARVALQQTRRREMAAQMTSGLAHDFSNLLTIILGMQSKLEKMPLPAPAQELIGGTLNAARRGGTLLNRIADMTGQRAPQLKATDLARVFADLRTLATPSLPEGITLVIDNQIPPAPLLLDAGMLQDSLLNLVLNARDACGSKGTITLRAALIKDTWVQIEVDDTGAGFSKLALTKALDPFFTTKGTDGSGLGLSMVYDTTKLMGGQLRIANMDQGARVTLQLPLRPVHDSRRPGLSLLVEDDAELRGVIRDMLTAQGHMVIEATSADEALALMDQVPEITLVLSDIDIEGDATGVDLITTLTQRALPAYLMTSFPRTHPLYVKGAQIAPVIRKPFTAEALRRFLTAEDQT